MHHAADVADGQVIAEPQRKLFDIVIDAEPFNRESRGESREHRMLKFVGMLWLVKQGCQVVMDEPEGFRGVGRGKRNDRRWRADVAGIQRLRRGRSIDWIVRVIEVKVSRSDFLAGYCVGAHYNHVLSLPGLISPDDLEDGVGLLEADPQTCVLDGHLHPHCIRVIRRASRMEMDNADEMVRRILWRGALRYTWRQAMSGWRRVEREQDGQV